MFGSSLHGWSIEGWSLLALLRSWRLYIESRCVFYQYLAIVSLVYISGMHWVEIGHGFRLSSSQRHGLVCILVLLSSSDWQGIHHIGRTFISHEHERLQYHIIHIIQIGSNRFKQWINDKHTYRRYPGCSELIFATHWCRLPGSVTSLVTLPEETSRPSYQSLC